MANFYSRYHGSLVVNAVSFASGIAANPCLVNFHMVARSRLSDPVCIGANHASPQLVQDLKGRLVAAQSKLALELYCAHTSRMARHQIGGPEPRRERSMGALHNRCRRQRHVFAAGSAAQHMWTVGEAE